MGGGCGGKVGGAYRWPSGPQTRETMPTHLDDRVSLRRQPVCLLPIDLFGATATEPAAYRLQAAEFGFPRLVSTVRGRPGTLATASPASVAGADPRRMPRTRPLTGHAGWPSAGRYPRSARPSHPVPAKVTLTRYYVPMHARSRIRTCRRHRPLHAFPAGRVLGFFEMPEGMAILEVAEDYILGRVSWVPAQRSASKYPSHAAGSSGSRPAGRTGDAPRRLPAWWSGPNRSGSWRSRQPRAGCGTSDAQ